MRTARRKSVNSSSAGLFVYFRKRGAAQGERPVEPPAPPVELVQLQRPPAAYVKPKKIRGNALLPESFYGPVAEEAADAEGEV